MLRSLSVIMILTSCSRASESPPAGTLTIDPAKTVHETSRKKLTGSNIALWNQTWELFDDELEEHVRKLDPTFIRMPGGSWANHYIWNGNGIRDGKTFDLSKLKDGVWDVDFSGYAPGFNIEGDERTPAADGFHGNVGVKELHELIQKFDADTIVTVNVGSGTPELAAEWVRWANEKQGYNVKYWELGNELEGGWELGHILPDGRKMTGEIYAERFRAFAEAMKAVDPSIKTGGPASSNDRGAFIKEVLRDSGDLVDFVSFHSYPVEKRPKSESEMFTVILELEKPLKQIRGWIEKYQPERKDEIEIAITEWNSKVVEDRDTADLLNGLWSCVWVGEMFRNGVTFSTQWDMLTATETGGHGLFYFKQFDFDQPGVPQKEMDRLFQAFNPPCIPKSQYWSFYLWNHFMGDRLVSASLAGAPDVYSVVTRSDDALQIMLVNWSREEAATIRLDSAEPLAGAGRATRLSHREYFWNPFAREPVWSRPPEPVALTLGADAAVTVAPFSAMVVEVPFASAKPSGKAKRVFKATAPALRLLMPETTTEDVPVEAWVLAEDIRPGTPGDAVLSVELSVEGPAKLDRQQVRINEAAGRFFITPTAAGEIKVAARSGTKTAKKTLEILPVQERTEVLWDFEGEQEKMGIRSDFDLSLSDTVKPNQKTGAIKLENSLPESGKDILLAFEPIPASVPKDRIGGFVFEVKTSHDFVTGDGGAQILVVLQSEADHWMPLGQVSLTSEHGKDWESVELRIKDPARLPSMKWLYAVRLLLVAGNPVSGQVYIDDAGFILR